MSQTRQKLETRARNAILQEAFFRWESGLNLGLVLVLAVLVPTYWWVFLILGIILEAFIGWRTLKNPDLNAKAITHMFEKELQTKPLDSQELKNRVDQAVEYFRQIEMTVWQTDAGPSRDRLKHITDEMVDWIEGIYHLAARLDTHLQDHVIAQDLENVPAAIKKLRRRLIEEDDPVIKHQIEAAIRDREDQYASLQKLTQTMQNAELLLERNLSDMGRVYSQVQLMSSIKETSGKGQALQDEISDHVDQIQDQVEVMDEIYGGRQATYHRLSSSGD